MKLKTHKALSKRIKITKKGKILKRTAGQDHFNSNESSKTTRNKRSDKEMTKTVRKGIARSMPYSL
ncbi:MAG: 50S ribosomal protein L35 [Candidatus Uhrbacteria bacterium]|nr:50S ribosomal protein L35 [Candidatus Uhrbacteria bacterium]